MFNVLSLKYPLINRINGADTSLLRKFLLVGIGNILLIIATKISIPLFPVPVTMQTLGVLFISMIYGWRLGGLTLSVYLIEGLMGLPVFAGVLQGPTAGYLLGFLLAGLLTGFVSERGWGRSKIGVFILGVLGSIVIYSCGVAILSRFVGFTQAIALGVIPFLAIDAVKVLLLTIIVPLFWRKQA